MDYYRIDCCCRWSDLILLRLRVMRWISRHHGACVLVLTLIVLALVLAHLWRLEILSTNWLSSNKDTLSALSSILTIAVLSTGSIFSYYSFFRGRTFSLRANLELEASKHQAPSGEILQVYSFVVNNAGTSTIWNPRPIVKLVWHGPGDQQSERTVDYWVEEVASNSEDQIPVIEPSESAQFFGQHSVPKEIWAVTYHATLVDDSNHSWSISKTFSNKVSKSNPET